MEKVKELMGYIKSDAKSFLIVLLLTSNITTGYVIVYLAKDNKDLSVQIIQSERDKAKEAKEDLIQERIRAKDFIDLTNQQKELLNLIQKINYENNNNDNRYPYNNDRHRQLFNPDNKKGY